MTVDAPLLERVAAAFTQVGGSVRVRSVANPVLWMFSVSVAAYVAVVVTGREPPLPVTLPLYASSTLTVCSIAYFSIRAPDRLQDKELQFKKRTLIQVAEKGTEAQFAEPADLALAARQFPAQEE